ncbi:MAG: response regulator [Chloroflexota bacterium]
MPNLPQPELSNKENEQAKVLIIEDDRTMQGLLTTLVQDLGHIPIPATTGKEAKLMLESGQFALCLLDLMLPDTTGQALCEYIRTFSSIPILVVSGQVNPDVVVELLQLGADDYVTKSTGLSIIRSVIRAQMRRAAWAEQANQRKRKLAEQKARHRKPSVDSFVAFPKRKTLLS